MTRSEQQYDATIDLLAVWQTNNRVTEFFIENLPRELWEMKIPGAPRRTIRMIAGHFHNARCAWIKMIGRSCNVKPPQRVDRRRVHRGELLRALKRSSRGVAALLNAGLRTKGVLKMKVPYQNIPPDVAHFLAYLVAHEAHHRGQIVLAARALGYRLEPEITAGLWQWTKRLQESRI